MMVTIKKPKNYKNITQCLICDSPLGSDSRDMYSVFCHEHMNCMKCGEPVSPTEAQTSYNRFYESVDDDEGEKEEDLRKTNVEVMHARCYILDKEPSVPIKQSELDTLNQIRLMVMPDMDLNIITNENNAKIQSTRFIRNMTIDQMRMHMYMLEACAAWVKGTIKQSPEYRKDDDRKLEKERFATPKTSTTSAVLSDKDSQNVKPPVANREVAIKRFMEVYGITDKARGVQLFKERRDAAKGLMKSLNLSEEVALEMAAKFMAERLKA